MRHSLPGLLVAATVAVVALATLAFLDAAGEAPREYRSPPSGTTIVPLQDQAEVAGEQTAQAAPPAGQETVAAVVPVASTRPPGTTAPRSRGRSSHPRREPDPPRRGDKPDKPAPPVVPAAEHDDHGPPGGRPDHGHRGGGPGFDRTG